MAGKWYVVAAGDIIRAEPHGAFIAWTRNDPSESGFNPQGKPDREATQRATLIVQAVNSLEAFEAMRKALRQAQPFLVAHAENCHTPADCEDTKAADAVAVALALADKVSR